MTNSEIREWYLRKVAAIPDLVLQWQKENVPLEEQARRAWKIRHDARLEARDLASDRLGVTLIRARDLLYYGHSDGPAFEQLIAAARKKGLTPEETYRRIIAGAQKTNEILDRVVLGRRLKKKSKKNESGSK